MNTGCEEGLRLRMRFEKDLREWGWLGACEKAIEIMPVGLSKVHEFQRQVKNAESALSKARHALIEHMAHCLTCSRVLVLHDVVSIVDGRFGEIVRR